MKIKLPTSEKIKSIKTWYFVHFKDKAFDSSAPPHYYVIIPSKSGYLIVCLITSNVESRVNYYNFHTGLSASLVHLNNNDLIFIDRKCVIDCNKPEIFTMAELEQRIDSNIWFDLIEEVNDKIKKKVFDAINSSIMVEEAIKKDL